MTSQAPQQRAASWMLTVCGIWLLALGAYFIFLRPALLPEDLWFMGTSLAQVYANVPGLEGWLRKVFTVMGGFMTGTGVLTVFIGRVAMPLRLKGTAWAIGLSGAATVALMSAMNFALRSDFRWLLAIAPTIWAASLLMYLVRR